MPEIRAPFDGRPYYCAVCGAGWQEYGACEEPDCELETPEESAQRAEEEFNARNP